MVKISCHLIGEVGSLQQAEKLDKNPPLLHKEKKVPKYPYVSIYKLSTDLSQQSKKGLGKKCLQGLTAYPWRGFRGAAVLPFVIFFSALSASPPLSLLINLII